MTNKLLLYQNTTLHYQVAGTGKTVVLIHGFGEHSDIWDQLIIELKDSFHLIIPELPGTGKTQLIQDMSMEGMAETIKAILDQEEIPQAILVGHSMGGYITMAFAEKYPALLKAYCLFHSSAYADTEEKKATRRKGIQFIRDHGAFEFLKTATPNLFSPKTRDERPELIDRQIRGLSNFSADSLVSYYEAMIQRPDRREILKISKVPVLFLAGENDNAIPLADVLEQCHLPEISYIDVLNQSGHMGMLEEPDECTEALKNFLTHQMD
ncbi:MAG: alpha/beta hydrolase [Sphingobacteriales bacterium 12-47-4]|nr:MAG: alpha/beta hydrolase [Sphingobacteriales bacterium 12-47-4]